MVVWRDMLICDCFVLIWLFVGFVLRCYAGWFFGVLIVNSVVFLFCVWLMVFLVVFYVMYVLIVVVLGLCCGLVIWYPWLWVCLLGVITCDLVLGCCLLLFNY